VWKGPDHSGTNPIEAKEGALSRNTDKKGKSRQEVNQGAQRGTPKPAAKDGNQRM